MTQTTSASSETMIQRWKQWLQVYDAVLVLSVPYITTPLFVYVEPETQ